MKNVKKIKKETILQCTKETFPFKIINKKRKKERKRIIYIYHYQTETRDLRFQVGANNASLQADHHVFQINPQNAVHLYDQQNGV